MLTFGGDVISSAELVIVCRLEVRVGAGSFLGWETLIMDTDFHHVVRAGDTKERPVDQAVTIGETVWIGARSVILKGSVIGDGSVVAAAARVAGRFPEPNQLLVGNPATVAGTDVSWRE
jgi:acetyltransferase-like isoleucine patch superfamily enzyme